MSKILEENKRRNKILDAHYDPILGIGSSIKRQVFDIADFEDKIHLPLSMMNLPWMQELAEKGNMRDFIRKHGMKYPELAFENYPEEVLIDWIVNTRFDHDFEFWAATCVKIKPKKGGDFSNFIFNYPQRLLWKELYDMISVNHPIFFILLKSRQFGGSTLIDVLSAFIQTRIKTNWNSLIAAHINQGATNIRSMTSCG